MRRRLSLAILTILAASPAGACRCGAPTASPAPDPGPQEAGERVTIPGAAATILVPEGWTREIEADVLSLIGPGERAVLTVMVVAAADLEASLAALDQQLAKVVQRAELRELREREIGGMPALIGDGQGHLGDDPVDLDVMLVRGPEGGIIIIFGIALKDADDGAIAAILDSLRPSS